MDFVGQYKDKRKLAEALRKREAGLLVTEAKQKTEEYVARRTALAEQKIGQAERDAINEVRTKAVDIAVEAARTVLAKKVDVRVNDELFKASVRDLKTRLN